MTYTSSFSTLRGSKFVLLIVGHKDGHSHQRWAPISVIEVRVFLTLESTAQTHILSPTAAEQTQCFGFQFIQAAAEYVA